MRNSILAAVLALAAIPAAAQLITPRGGAPELLIPIAGTTPGANGTFFRSDVTIINYRSADQRIFFFWLPQGVTGSSTPAADLVVPSKSGIVSEDFVTNTLHMTGVGAILVRGVTATGAFDASARIVATCRVWTPQTTPSTGANGTYSISLPTIGTDDINALSLAIVGHRADARYRTNVGVVNLDPTFEQTYQVLVNGASGPATQQVTVPPFSMQQFPITVATQPALQIVVTNVSTNRLTPFQAFASSVDNVTGDGWSSLGFVPALLQNTTP